MRERRGTHDSVRHAKRRRGMLKKVSLLLAVAVVALAAVGAAGARRSDDSLTGAGSSFVAPLVGAWVNEYGGRSGTTITYAPIGSGGGIASITARTVDFGASDAPLSGDQ